MKQFTNIYQIIADYLSIRTENVLNSNYHTSILREIGVSIGREVITKALHGNIPSSTSNLSDYLTALEWMKRNWEWIREVQIESSDCIKVFIPHGAPRTALTSDHHLCEIASGIVGGIAGDLFGYAKVLTPHCFTSPPTHCGLTVHLARSPVALECEGICFPLEHENEPNRESSETLILDLLSSRERQILRLIGEGLSDKEIANTLNLSVRTVEGHLVRMRQKSGLGTRHGLIRLALLTRQIGRPQTVKQALLDKQGHAIRVGGASTDITEQKQPNEASSARSKTIQDILDTMFGFVGLYSLEGRIIEINRAPLDAIGASKEDVVGRLFWETPWWSDLPDMQQRLQDWIRRAAQGESIRGELQFRVKGNHLAIADTTFTPLRDAAGNLIHILGFGVDITERKRVEAALRVSEKRFSLAMDATNDGLWDWNIQANDTYLSPQWKALLGFKDEELPNHPDTFFHRLHPEDVERVQAATEAHVQGQANFDLELRLRHKEGHYRWFRSRGKVQRDIEGRPSQMIGSITDITESK